MVANQIYLGSDAGLALETSGTSVNGLSCAPGGHAMFLDGTKAMLRSPSGTWQATTLPMWGYVSALRPDGAAWALGVNNELLFHR